MKTAIGLFLKNGGTHEQLLERFSIKAKPHPKYSNLVLYKYDQIASPFAEEIVRECRGIVLDHAAEFRVVSQAFNKFFNHGEGLAATIDWSTASVQEKVDGSLCTIYAYDGGWHVATTGTADGGGDVNGYGVSFAEYFWDTFEKLGMHVPDVDDVCVFMELSGPMNRIVVKHSEPMITVLGARERMHGTEYGPTLAARLVDGTPVKSFDLSNIESVIETFSSMSPLAQEGYVICDAKFNRIKVKHPGYVALHHMATGGLNPKSALQIVRNGELSEVLANFPEYGQLLHDADEKLAALSVNLRTTYEKIQHIESQKYFAAEALKTRFSAPLFMMRAKKIVGFDEFVKDVRLDTLADMLGVTAEDAQ